MDAGQTVPAASRSKVVRHAALDPRDCRTCLGALVRAPSKLTPTMERDKVYFYQGAEAELKLAQQAAQAAVVKAHYQLAGYYLDRVYGGGDQAWTSSVGSGGTPLSDAFAIRPMAWPLSCDP